jgi:transcriptional regulator with XRE-family HTH domain
MPMAKNNTPIRQILNPPPGELPADAPAGHARAEFAHRIQHLMAKAGWNQADLARAASKHLPRGVEMGRDSISYYVRGKAFPSAPRVNALAMALGVKPDDLVPTRGVKTAGDPSLEMRTMADGRVWLRVNKEVDPAVAAKIVTLLSRGG